VVPTLRPTGKINYFRIATTDNHQGPAGADYLFKTKGYKSVYVIDDAETYGVGIADAFSKEWQALGGKLLGRSSEPSTTISYVSLLTQIAAKHPDLIYFGGLNSTGGNLIRKQMLQVPGLQKTPLAGGDGIEASDFASVIGVNQGGPAYATVAVVDTSKNPAAQTFVKQYDAVYSTISVYSAAAYDCTNILIQAIKTALANGVHTPQNSSDAAGAKTFRQAVINAIQNISFDGVTGHQAFDANGDTTNKIISIYQVADNSSGKPDWIFQTQVTIH
jgi:branched-chain amino acid transport system substrate-binding protein